MSDREDILGANRAFYRAFESLDVDKMGEVWLKDPSIVCIHPGWAKLSGWGPVMESWARIFDNTFEMKFELGEIDVMISGDIAVAIVQENLTQSGYDGPSRSQVLATNVFQRVGRKRVDVDASEDGRQRNDWQPPPLIRAPLLSRSERPGYTGYGNGIPKED
jgi:ketosteroid isomerase-like protein